VFADQSGIYLLPTVVRTYAPVGRTPVLKGNLTRDHLSAMSGITLDGKLYMIEQQGAFKVEDAVRSLKHLIRQIPGKLLVVSGMALRCIAEGRNGISDKRGGFSRAARTTTLLYAPDLNPDEGV
jgi:hypothetical protein